MKTISVIGSCVCRDLFEKDNGQNYSFYTDIRFSSPISMLSKPVDFIHADFDCLRHKVEVVGTNWYKKNLINDINKTSFDALKEKHGEYLVLDLAESRISLANIRWKSKIESLIVSNSVTFRGHYKTNLKKNIFKDTVVDIKNPLEFDDAFWEKTIEDFAKKITSIFKEDKIILIKNMPAKYFVDSSDRILPYYSDTHFNSIMLCDILLPKLYSYFLENCPKCNVIEIPPFGLGFQAHKWGNHPFHFNERYYEYLLKCINEIIVNGSTKQLNKLYCEYSEIFRDDFYKCMINTARSKDQNVSSTFELLQQYEDFNHLGRKKKLLIAFALDKKHLIKNLRNIMKK